MAWYRCGGGDSGKDRPIYKTLKIHSGKINIRNGTIESDDTYYYTDAIPFSSDITFDMGLAQTGLNYDGIALYDSSDVWVDFYAATQRYRNISYSGNATICRLSFRASNLHYIMFHDWINNIMYSTEEVVRITDDEDVPLGTKTITENGTYSAQDDGLLGYSEVEVDVAGGEIDKVYFQTSFSRGATPLTITLLETANKTSHIKLTGSVWAPSIPTGYTATTGTISNNSFTTTETSDYHWDYVQEFDITCGNDNAVIVYNGGLNNASEVSLNVYHIYNLASKTITQNGTYNASDDNADGYSSVTVDVAEEPLPSVVYFSSVNGSSDTVMSYTFTESGIYQIYSLIKYGDALLSSPTLELNDVAISVQTYSNPAYIIVYAQIEVSSGDVLKCVPTATGANSGRQLVVLNGANFDPFTFIGYVPNDGSRFDITGSKFALEVYNMGYWQGNNNYQYHIIAGEAQSVPIPGGSGYYYGGIYAIKLQ